MNLMLTNYKEELANHNDKFSAETSVDHSLSSSSLNTDDFFGDPDVLFRIGDDYQVEIPTLIANSEHRQIQYAPSNDGIDFDFCAGEGLAIPLMWLDQVADHSGIVHGEQLATATASDAFVSHATVDWGLDFKCSKSSENFQDGLNSYHHTLPQVVTCKFEQSDYQQDHGKQFSSLAKQQCGSDIAVRLRKTIGYIPLPDSPVTRWTDAESLCFVLGLYIFGKNLVQVQRFVDSKDMGDVLSFYYGEFFRSDAHRRWVECRKTRSRRCILGHRIFTGWRQHEILSRLLSGRSKEVHDTLFEATRAFNEGSASLEDFIFTIKAVVGTKALVQAVGIGKGKRDLTGISLDSLKTNTVVSARPEVPAGKACSSLTPGEIVKFLTGGFRLSKAKSNDIFWEAVWPRLLARGWHSEQPKYMKAFSSKNALVFLIPGIKKFSRKKLTKGNHYFDSVTDVLNRVASDPKLMELEAEESKESTKISDHQRPCYLRPRAPDCSSELLKFTVVDTSLFQGGAPSEVRELRVLPTEATRPLHHQRPGGTNNGDISAERSSSGDTTSESYQNPSDDKKSKNSRRKTSLKGVLSFMSDSSATESKRSSPMNGLDDVEGQGCKLFINKQFKRQRLTSCKSVGASHGSSSVPVEHDLNKGVVHFQSESVENSRAIDTKHKAARRDTNEAVPSKEKKPQIRTLIDLNLQPQDFDCEGPLALGMGVDGSHDHLEPEVSVITNSQELRNTAFVVDEEQHPVANGRRQSTRNRPPTAKALEAHACGFLSVKKGRSLKPKPSHRARKNIYTSLAVTDTITPSVGVNECYPNTEHTSFFDNSRTRADEREGPHELFGVL